MLNAIRQRQTSIAVVGLGYVGLPLAVAFSQVAQVIGFDVNESKIALYKGGFDPTNEVGDEQVLNCSVQFTSNPSDLVSASFVIIAVPTPVDNDRMPDLKPIEGASRLVGRNLRRGAIVVYESTVFPGVTEDVCIPILERESELKCGTDFKVGYSPERINPGDKTYRLDTITKIVSGFDQESLEQIATVYGLVVKAGVYRVKSIKVAEAAKVVENAQRDINIAFVNELSMIFNKMEIDTLEVLQAAGTKWNFLNFRPGLVGGHCIGVDPYYLTYRAEQLGYHPEVILAGRRINDTMGRYIAANLIKLFIKQGCPVKDAKVLILGLTFKEDVPDVRNTKVIDIVRELEDFGVKVIACDPHARQSEVIEQYGIELSDLDHVSGVDAVIVAVGHCEYKTLSLDQIRSKLAENSKIIVDIKGLFDKTEAEKAGLTYWRL